MTRFYVGLHQPSDAVHFQHCMVSVTRLKNRRSCFGVREWMLDSGAFTELFRHGRFRSSPEEYGSQVIRWWRCGYLIAAVSQDFMCEPFILEKTGLNVQEHQRQTIERYVAIRRKVGPLVYILPVLQGYWPEEYVSHIEQYGELLRPGQWVGVGSVCKRNADVEEIEAVLMAVKRARPDIRLHGFGVKLTALRSSVVRDCLWRADSMAWSYSARKQGRNGNSYLEAKRFEGKINEQPVKHRAFQMRFF